MLVVGFSSCLVLTVSVIIQEVMIREDACGTSDNLTHQLNSLKEVSLSQHFMFYNVFHCYSRLANWGSLATPLGWSTRTRRNRTIKVCTLLVSLINHMVLCLSYTHVRLPVYLSYFLSGNMDHSIFVSILRSVLLVESTLALALSWYTPLLSHA